MRPEAARRADAALRRRARGRPYLTRAALYVVLLLATAGRGCGQTTCTSAPFTTGAFRSCTSASSIRTAPVWRGSRRTTVRLRCSLEAPSPPLLVCAANARVDRCSLRLPCRGVSGHLQPPLVVAARRRVRAGALQRGRRQRHCHRLSHASGVVGGPPLGVGRHSARLPAGLHPAAARGPRVVVARLRI
eukprot:3223718-Prymnesium_polylepis.1